jgi:tyrosyl-tRNA synthetase
MDTETRLQLIKGIAREIITEDELRKLLETNAHPIAYDGFEPSGKAHIAFGVYRALLLKELLKAGIKFKLWLADWFAWINNKMAGDLEKIKKVGEYFVEVWKAAGIDMSAVKVLWASEEMNNEYWKKVITIAKHTTVERATRCLSIMGRRAGELKETAQYFYPMMQCADIFHLGVDICQLGLDQRRVNILSREIAERLKWKKPVLVHHHMIPGLEGQKQHEGYDEVRDVDIEIGSKMSKSKPQSCIYVHDSASEIKEKIVKSAFCLPNEAKNNVVLEYFKEIVFRAFRGVKIERDRRYGGDISFSSYTDLEKSYIEGKIHPLDLKNALAWHLDKLISPIRAHFEKDKKAKELYSFIKTQEITR